MIEFEHTLFLILLLWGLKNARLPRPGLSLLAILVGIGFAFIPPSVKVDIPWVLVTGLVLPLLVWQNIRLLVRTRWLGWKPFVYWGFTAALFSVFLQYIGGYEWAGALLFGMITASLIWAASEPENAGSYMSLIGTLTLIFLLTEVDLAVISLSHYVGGIFSAAFIGIMLALLALWLLRRTPESYHPLISIGHVYLAYWLSYLLEVSPIAATLIGTISFVWLRRYTRLGLFKETRVAPLNTWPGFGLVLLLFVFLGWQSHQPISSLIVLEALLGGALAIGIAWLGSRLKMPAFEKTPSLLVLGFRVMLLLFPALLIWPRHTLQQPYHLLIAIGLAALMLGISYGGLSMYLPREDLERT